MVFYLTHKAYRIYCHLVKTRQTFRFYPSRPQERVLARVFGCVRLVYNKALRYRTDSYAEDKTSINYEKSSAALTGWKKQDEFAFLREVSCVPLQQTLRHLQTAFRNFFEKRAAYPKFKSKRGKQSAEYTRSAFKWDGRNRNLRVSGLGRLRIRWSRAFESEPSTVTITKDCCGRYFVTLCLDETIRPLPKTGEAVGIDLGINRLATLSNGERIPNPKHLGAKLGKLAKAQRVLSRRKKDSGRWKRQKLVVAKIQSRIAASRKDHMDKTTIDLVRKFDVLCVEDLNVRGMMANVKLARAIGDAGFGMFTRMLEYKIRWYGKEVKKVDRWFPSSKKCHHCGFVVEKLPLSVREWDCPECDSHHDRDENAAKNLLAAGHVVTARGGRVRRKSATAGRRNARRTVNQPALSRV